MNHAMIHSFVGRLRNFKAPKDSLTPLFEAISNSIQSIDEGSVDKGEINITINRSSSNLVEGPTAPIFSISITDNGTGFNNQNFDSFKTFDSLYKLSHGGKGIGRLNWLKVFDKVSVDSIYETLEGNKYISFDFSANEGIHNVVEKPTVSNRFTSITLISVKNEYKKKMEIQFNELIDRLIEHFTSFLVIGSQTKILLIEGNKSVSINDYFKNEKFVKDDSQDIEIEGNKFEIKHVFMKSSHYGSHKIFICAHKRVVKAINIPSVEDLPSSFSIENQKAIYQCFVSSELLDKDVNQERSEFNSISFEKNDNENFFAEKTILETILKSVSIYLDKHLEPIKIEKMELLKAYVDETAPMYRYLFKNNRDDLERISYSVVKSKNKEKIDVELYKIRYKQMTNSLKKLNELDEIDQVTDESLNSLIESFTDEAKSELAGYILKRKHVLELLGKMIRYEDSAKYFKEQKLHRLFFPMKSDDIKIDYNQHNLWLIDERLAYSYSFFSDIPIRKIFKDSESKQRPDGLFLDAVAMTDSTTGKATNVIIVEFKRPGRDDYTYTDNPFIQVFQYIDEIRGKTNKGQNGDIIAIDSNTKFVAYIIADITNSLLQLFKQYSIYPASDGESYFGLVPQYNLYIEITPYKTVIDNSEKRNKVFFDKLFK